MLLASTKTRVTLQDKARAGELNIREECFSVISTRYHATDRAFVRLLASTAVSNSPVFLESQRLERSSCCRGSLLVLQLFDGFQWHHKIASQCRGNLDDSSATTSQRCILTWAEGHALAAGNTRPWKDSAGKLSHSDQKAASSKVSACW